MATSNSKQNSIITNLAGKSILITQNDMFQINGSSVIVLELVDFFLSKGMKVTVYTFFLRDPVKRLLESRNIKIVADDETELKLSDYDYVWVHHQVLPKSIIRSLSLKTQKQPIIIFNHMSPHEWIADEMPYVWGLENNLASISLFNSEETLEKQNRYISKNIPRRIFPNPAPESFNSRKKAIVDELKRLLVVSNHPPEEVTIAVDLLRRSGVAVVMLGENLDKYDLLTPEMLEGYDAVLTIGKTVQYCLVGGIPVYVYDYFGGPGYLNAENIKNAQKHNFSGRGFDKKSASKIFGELQSGISEASEYQLNNKDSFIDEFSLNKAVARILDNNFSLPSNKLDNSLVDYFLLAHNYSRGHRIGERMQVVWKQKAEQLECELEAIRKSRAHKLASKVSQRVARVRGARSLGR